MSLFGETPWYSTIDPRIWQAVIETPAEDLRVSVFKSLKKRLSSTPDAGLSGPSQE